MKKSSKSNSIQKSNGFIAFYANRWIIVVLNPNMESLRVSLYIFKTKIRKTENPKIKNDSEINVCLLELYIYSNIHAFISPLFYPKKKNYVFSFQIFSTSHFIRFSALNRWSCQFHSNSHNSVRVIKVYRLLCNLNLIIKSAFLISKLTPHPIIEWSACLTSSNKSSCRA